MLVRRNRILGIFLFVFSLIYLYFSFRLPPYDLVPVDSDVVPIVLGIILMILSIILFFSKGSEEDEAKQKKLIPENIKDLYKIGRASCRERVLTSWDAVAATEEGKMRIRTSAG